MSRRICGVLRYNNAVCIVLAIGAVYIMAGCFKQDSYWSTWKKTKQITRSDVDENVTTALLKLEPAVPEMISTQWSRESQATGDVEQVLLQRWNTIQAVCKRIGAVNNKTTTIIGNRAANLSYCVVAKAGCTLWLRMLKFLEGQQRDSGTPMAISKHQVHYAGLNFIKYFPQDRIENKQFVYSSVRVMTVRDPYTRLWSAYIDKLILPDFWKTKGTMIIKGMRANPSSKSLQCGNDVTFSEFIKYVIKNGHDLTFWNQDKHWLPSSDVCDPCKFRPTIVTKQEAFMSEFAYVLKHRKLEHLLPKMKLDNPTDYEIQDEIDYNFKIFHYHSKCTDIVGICQLMWTAFILNGYLPPDEKFPENIKASSLSIQVFYDMVSSVRMKYNITKEYTKTRRRATLAEAYSTIPMEDREALVKLYKADFELFGYDSRPDYIR